MIAGLVTITDNPCGYARLLLAFHLLGKGLTGHDSGAFTNRLARYGRLINDGRLMDGCFLMDA